MAAVIIFASSALIFAWFPIAKTYSLTAVFLFGAYVISCGSRWHLHHLIAVAGLLFALSVHTGSYVVGIMRLLLWWMFHHPETCSYSTISDIAHRSNAGLIAAWEINWV